MPVPTRPDLGSANTAVWYLDVNTGTTAVPVWTPVMGVSEFTPNFEINLEDDTDYDSGGYGSQTKTGENWSVELTVQRKNTLASQGGTPVYDAGQEFLRGKSVGKFGAAASVEVRFYEYSDGGPRVEAYRGLAAVSWSPNGGPVTGLRSVAVTLTGKGKLNVVTHPALDTPAVPTLFSVAPATAPVAGGSMHTIKGQGFTGTVPTAGVKFGGTNATSFTVLDDYTIVAVAPARTAGSQPITVTNATGASAALPFTYA